MKIKATGWELYADFCCTAFRDKTSGEYTAPLIRVDSVGRRVYFEGIEIKYCPFCSKEIKLEKWDVDGTFVKNGAVTK